MSEGFWLDDVGLDPPSVSVEVGVESGGLLDSSGILDVLGEEDSVSTVLVLVLELAAAEDVSEEAELDIAALVVEL